MTPLRRPSCDLVRIGASVLVLAMSAVACRDQRSPERESSTVTSEGTTSIPGLDPSCDDTIPETNVPDGDREELGLADAGPVFGEGDV